MVQNYPQIEQSDSEDYEKARATKSTQTNKAAMSTEENQVTTGKDPTQAVLSDSSLDKKYLCDYVINVATGCRHGCKFCYVPSTPALRTRPEMLKDNADVDNAQREWGKYVLYRDDIPDRLEGILNRKQSWNDTDRGCGIVGISFATDCYMDGRAGEITRDAVRILSNKQKYTRVLTRNPILALQDIDTFTEAGDFVTIGSSIPAMDASEVGSIEPQAPSPQHRLRGLQEFAEAGVQTFVSMSPTYPTQSRSDLRSHLERLATCDPNVIFHEPINPRGGNFEMTVEAARDAGETELARQLEQLRNREQWLSYSIEHFKAVQEIGEELDLPIHLWPDRQHVKYAESDVATWLQAWKDRQSPEEFAGRNCPSKPMPEIPSSL